MTAPAARKVKTINGWSAQARWLAVHDLTALEFPSDKLPKDRYAYSLTKVVYTDITGRDLFCLVEVAHRRFEVWAVSRDGCVEAVAS